MALALHGCRGAPARESTAPGWPYAPGQRPQFLVLYLPYLPDGTPLARSSPRTEGWTDQHMGRDLSRLEAVGADGLILGLYPEVIADATPSERIGRFAAMLSERNGSLRTLVLMLYASPGRARSVASDDVGKWLITTRLHLSPAVRRLDGRVMVVLAPGLTLSGPPHPAVAFVPAGTPGAAWTWGAPADARRLQPAGADRQVLVYAGWRGDASAVDSKGRPVWELPRDRGQALERELQAAYAVQAGTICVSSWNNYVAGDFVEPNSLDGEVVSRALATAIRRAREAASAKATRP